MWIFGYDSPLSPREAVAKATGVYTPPRRSVGGNEPDLAPGSGMVRMPRLCHNSGAESWLTCQNEIPD